MHTTAITPTHDFLIADLTGSDYDKLVISKQYDSYINGVNHHMPMDFSGLILMDFMSMTGAKSNERFLSGRVVKGKLEPTSLTFVNLNRNDEMRVLSNQTLVHHCSDSLDATVLTVVQQKMLLKGFSI